jgi:glycerophosphoryl diester phosphodiesterase
MHQEAVRRGATVIELDVRLTRDREVVVFHDCRAMPTLEGSCRGIAIEELSLAELQLMPFGAPVDREQRVITLRRVLEFCTQHDLRIVIETKDVASPRLLIRNIAHLLIELDCVKRACIASFDPRSLWYARRRLPSIPTMMLYAPGAMLPLLLNLVCCLKLLLGLW